MENANIEFCKWFLQTQEKNWVQRNRKLTTTIVFNNLLKSLLSNTGISSVIQFSNTCNHSSVFRFRQKLPMDLFQIINQELHNNKLQNHIFAIDGHRLQIKNK